jgi:threonine synthase
MQYFSLNKNSPLVNFETATIGGQAPDKGLYFPTSIPVLPKGFIQSLPTLHKVDIGVEVMQPFIGNSIPKTVISDIVNEAISFDFPLVTISKNIASLELYHGPTLAFKDVGARFMSRCLGYFNRNNNKKITVLVATSGDTGGAVADGFLGVEGVEVIILYPSKKVSLVQELQLTTLGKNIKALEINGTFDDCQNIVKNAFLDVEINKKFTLTSANSINIARWLPQQLYYFYAYMQWQQKQAPLVSVPSGNFGNICAGLLAHKTGLPVGHFIAACNANDVVNNYFATQQYLPQPSVATISNAMDVSNPSNFIRILQLCNNNFSQLSSIMTSYSINDSLTKQTIEGVYKKYNYILDPHAAVAYAALELYLQSKTNENGYILETAHPVKFNDIVEEIINKKIEMPQSIQHLSINNKVSVLLDNSFDTFKNWMIHSN